MHARTDWSDEARFGPFRQMYYNRQTSYDFIALMYDSVVLTEIPESYEVCRLMVNNETSYDSVVLMNDTRVMRGLPIDGDQ